MIALYNCYGDINSRYTYDSWGSLIAVTDANGNAITDPTHIANVNPIRYRGYYYDTETGLYYLQSRYYNPQWGRFLNADDMSVLDASAEDILATNLFTYCGNNPVNHKDPTGYKKIVIKTWIVASMLDAILFMATSGGSLSFSAVGLALIKLATGKSTKKLAEKLLFGKVVPVFIRGYKNIFLTAVRKVIKRATGVAVVGLNIRLVDVALGRLKRYNIGNIAGMFLSWGSFISGLLDLSDSKLDGKITIKT